MGEKHAWLQAVGGVFRGTTRESLWLSIDVGSPAFGSLPRESPPGPLTSFPSWSWLSFPLWPTSYWASALPLAGGKNPSFSTWRWRFFGSALRELPAFRLKLHIFSLSLSLFPCQAGSFIRAAFRETVPGGCGASWMGHFLSSWPPSLLAVSVPWIISHLAKSELCQQLPFASEAQNSLILLYCSVKKINKQKQTLVFFLSFMV